MPVHFLHPPSCPPCAPRTASGAWAPPGFLPGAAGEQWLICLLQSSCARLVSCSENALRAPGFRSVGWCGAARDASSSHPGGKASGAVIEGTHHITSPRPHPEPGPPSLGLGAPSHWPLCRDPGPSSQAHPAWVPGVPGIALAAPENQTTAISLLGPQETVALRQSSWDRGRNVFPVSQI